MPAKGPNIIPKQAPSPIAIAGSPPSSSASTPRSAASPPVSVNTKYSPNTNSNTIMEENQVLILQRRKEKLKIELHREPLEREEQPEYKNWNKN